MLSKHIKTMYMQQVWHVFAVLFWTETFFKNSVCVDEFLFLELRREKPILKKCARGLKQDPAVLFLHSQAKRSHPKNYQSLKLFVPKPHYTYSKPAWV